MDPERAEVTETPAVGEQQSRAVAFQHRRAGQPGLELGRPSNAHLLKGTAPRALRKSNPGLHRTGGDGEAGGPLLAGAELQFVCKATAADRRGRAGRDRDRSLKRAVLVGQGQAHTVVGVRDLTLGDDAVLDLKQIGKIRSDFQHHGEPCRTVEVVGHRDILHPHVVDQAVTNDRAWRFVVRPDRGCQEELRVEVRTLMEAEQLERRLPDTQPPARYEARVI
jgi:hypothetical protein